MSEGSVTGSDIDMVDLTSDDDDHPVPDNHDLATPDPQEIVVGLNGHGEPICHMVNGPEAVDLMDLDDIGDERDGLISSQLNDEESLFVEDDNNGDNGDNGPPGPPGPPSPPSSDGSDSADSEDDDGEDSVDNDSEDNANDADDGVIQSNQLPINGGNPGGDDPDDDGSGSEGSDNSSSDDDDLENGPDPNDDEDDDSINNQDIAGNVRHGWKNARAELYECLEEEQIRIPDFQGNCINTCDPPWLELARRFRYYRNKFLREREVLGGVRSRNRARVTELNRRIRQLLPKPRKTERTWPEVCRQWMAFGECRGYRDWGEIYKLSCKEENMSWAFSKNKRPNVHPHLRLRPPTDEEEALAIGGESESCSPRPRRGSFEIEQDDQPCHFDRLPEKLQVEILQLALVFDGELVHTISRLDPYYEPGSVHLNCNDRMSLIHRFHIGNEPFSLTFSATRPQRLLSPLLVCKQWNLVGSSLFYGANKFAFSSIGE
ncbi:hypothetical protein ACHAPU_000262 [Fusarium lateritium]